MPTFEQSSFLLRAVACVMKQSLCDWELIIVDDGSQDDTPSVIRSLPRDARIRSKRVRSNRGLGAAANVGLGMARGELVAYLPSDDVIYPSHLACLSGRIEEEEAVLAWSGARCGDGASLGPLDDYGLQMVQVMHRLTPDRWRERPEIESDDLDHLFWAALRARGRAVGTGLVTCEWTQHPHQRHRVMRESFDGGLNAFRSRFRVHEPLRFHSRDSSPVDEPALYRRFRSLRRSTTPERALRILLVGELSFNPERVLALVERGHHLFGLWISNPLGPQTVGPLPFGHVHDVPRATWREAVRAIRPDVVYALLNWRAVPLASEVLHARVGAPFVWHFKESPMRCRARGTWEQLIGLHLRSDARIYSTPQERTWFELALPDSVDRDRSLVIDGDLPKADWFTGPRSRRLSGVDGHVHTVNVGSPLGLDLDVVRALAGAGVHLHLHGLVRAPGPRGAWTTWLEDALRIAPRFVHIHPHIDQRGWVQELSRYDAGWLHRFESTNGGDLERATWDDLNYPARISTLAAAGLPLLHQHSRNATVAVQELIEDLGIGLVYRDLDDLCYRVQDSASMDDRRQAVDSQRHRFTFDHHVDRLVDLFEAVSA